MIKNGWWPLIRERFPLAAYGPMIAVFVAAHVVMAKTSAAVDFVSIAAIVVMTTSLFLRLRFFDEIKDYELDCKINPTRPLPRGVLTIAQVKQGITTLTLLELTLALFVFKWAGLWWLLPVLYSFVMFKEFFIGKFIRPHLTTYAIMHTLVSSILVLAMLQLLQNNQTFSLSTRDLLLSLIAWPLFNLFEFGRKSFLPNEERASVDTYTSLFGAWGAALLGISQVALALWPASLLLPNFISQNQWMVLYFASATTCLSALLFAAIGQSPYQKFYRTLSSAHILFFYLGLIISF
jgi:hypothetical protein